MRLALGIFAWNEESSIRFMLELLFKQSLFRELEREASTCQVICVANGCTDRTVEVAERLFTQQERQHPFAHTFRCEVANLAERGKNNAWNQFVHRLSAREAPILFMMDADILIHEPETIWRMLRRFETDRGANVVVDLPCKDIGFKQRKSLRERLSLAAARTTLAGEAQLCAQLYGIRAETARNIYLPRDLAACEDGFIKSLVCTDFLTHEVWPQRLALAQGAEHTFEAYTSPAALVRNQKRQALGQTIVHVLVDRELNSLPLNQRLRMAETLKGRDAADPEWLKRLIAEHLRRVRYFWRLYPGLLTQRLRAVSRLSFSKRLAAWPAACVACFGTLLGSWLAFRALKQGCTDYWPKARRLGFRPAMLAGSLRPQETLMKTGE